MEPAVIYALYQRCCSVSRMKPSVLGVEGAIRISVYDHDHGMCLCVCDVCGCVSMRFACVRVIYAKVVNSRNCVRLFDLITLTLDGGHDLIGAFRVSAASGGVGLSCTFRDFYPVTFTSLKEG